MGRTWLIAGASGVVGRYVMEGLLAAGVRLRVLSTSAAQSSDDKVTVIPWDPSTLNAPDSADLSSVIEAMNGADVVLNLAGQSLDSGRLGHHHRQQVLQSRLDSTGVLVAAWQQASSRPGRWLQGSAVGYYGDTGDECVGEDHAPGSLFLSEVCQQWEQAVDSVVSAGCMTSLLRLGLVLAPDAPAVARMLRPIRLGLGGRLGSGEQFWPWVTARDVAGAVEHLAGIDHSGPINIVAPGVVSQIEFTRQIARALGRPVWIPAPALALRLVAGGVADELVLPSCRAQADALLGTGFQFKDPGLTEAVRWLLPSRQ